jgi:hypothetical protein
MGLPITDFLTRLGADEEPLTLTRVVRRDNVLAMFEELARRGDLQDLFLDQPDTVLARFESDLSPQSRSADNALLVSLLRSEPGRTWLRNELSARPVVASAGRPRSASSFTHQNVNLVIHMSGSRQTSFTFTSGGVGVDPTMGLDPAALRLGIRTIVAGMRLTEPES